MLTEEPIVDRILEDVENLDDQSILELQIQIQKIHLDRKRDELTTHRRDHTNRAARLSNHITLKEAVERILSRYQTGLTKEEIARKIISEEDYQTDTTGDGWIRSVYQSGILPLLNNGSVTRDNKIYRLTA